MSTYQDIVQGSDKDMKPESHEYEANVPGRGPAEASAHDADEKLRNLPKDPNSADAGNTQITEVAAKTRGGLENAPPPKTGKDERKEPREENVGEGHSLGDRRIGERAVGGEGGGQNYDHGPDGEEGEVEGPGTAGEIAPQGSSGGNGSL